MRCTQIFGLSQKAKNFLNKHAERIPLETCPTCRSQKISRGFLVAMKLEGVHLVGNDYIQEVYDRETGVNAGMFEDGPELLRYKLKTGKWVKEIVQASPWSSGPCIFLCLEDEDGHRIGEWSKKEIDNA